MSKQTPKSLPGFFRRGNMSVWFKLFIQTPQIILKIVTEIIVITEQSLLKQHPNIEEIVKCVLAVTDSLQASNSHPVTFLEC